MSFHTFDIREKTEEQIQQELQRGGYLKEDDDQDYRERKDATYGSKNKNKKNGDAVLNDDSNSSSSSNNGANSEPLSGGVSNSKSSNKGVLVEPTMF